MQMDELQGKYPINPASKEHPFAWKRMLPNLESQSTWTFVNYETCSALPCLPEILREERKTKNQILKNPQQTMQKRFERTAPGIIQSTLMEVVILQFKYLFSADFKTVKEIWKRSPRFWWKLFWHKQNQAWHEVGAGSGQASGTDPGRIEPNWGNCFKMQLGLPEMGGEWRAQTFHQRLNWRVGSGMCFQEMQGPTRGSQFLPPPLGKQSGWCLEWCTVRAWGLLAACELSCGWFVGRGTERENVGH